LYGYVATSPKDAAQTILVSDQDDPILAAWQYGLGKAVAFTSDATGRWAREWIAWEKFPQFWGQIVRYTIGDPNASTLSVSVEQQGDTAQVIVDARDASGGYLNGYTLGGNVVNPDGSAQPIELQQTAPGRYEGVFQPRDQGAYVIGVSGQSPIGEALNERAGWVLSYSPEYRNLESDPDALYQLALAAQGQVATDNPAEAFAHTRNAPLATRPVWPWLLLIAVLLLPFDVGVRRLAIDRRDLRKAWIAIGMKLQARRTATAAVPARSERMTTLFQAKQRTHVERVERAEQAERMEPIEPASTDRAEAIPPPVSPTDRTTPPPDATATASTLLAKKRARKN
jgi:hypothetical protein